MRYSDEDIKKINELIIRTFDDLKAVFKAKNEDYGGSVYTTDPLCKALTPAQAIMVRINDKISRLVSLNESKEPSVKESRSDTLKDLAVYAIILACVLECNPSVCKEKEK